MNKVPDAFLLELAGIAASLLGFFVIGVFFYVQRGLFPQAGDRAQRYLQAATRSVIVLYGMTLLLSLALVVLDPSRVALLYLVLTFVLLGAVARASVAIRDLHRLLDIRVMSQTAMWAAAAAVATLPWALGGMQPSRSHLTWAILLIGVLAFTSSASLVLSVFDIARLEALTRRQSDREAATTPQPEAAIPRQGRGPQPAPDAVSTRDFAETRPTVKGGDNGQR